MNPRTWEASGHLGNFNDPMIDCKQCKARHRADKLIESALEAKGIEMVVDGLPFEKWSSSFKSTTLLVQIVAVATLQTFVNLT